MKARVHPPTFSLPRACDEWFVALADELPEQDGLTAEACADIADVLASRVHTWMGPVLLAVIAPDAVAPNGCPSARLPSVCKTEVKKHLPIFLSRIVSQLVEEEEGRL